MYLTISTRQQLHLSSVYYHGMFATSDLVITTKVTYKSSLDGKTEFEKAVMPYMNDTDFLCSEIEVRSQLYKNGQ